MLMSKQRGLGRGIGALIPNIDSAILENKEAIILVPVEELKTNPFQPRKVFQEDKIDELAESIREKGVLQPLLVKKGMDGYEIIAGERRLRAAVKAGLAMIPAIIKKVDDKTSQEIALIENIQREDLNVIEEAEAYQNLILRFQYTQEEIAKKVSKSRSTITNALRLLKLSQSIRLDLINNKISMGHARAYLGLESGALQEDIHRRVIKENMSVRETEKYINKHKSNKKSTFLINKNTPENVQLNFIADELKKRFATKVNILRKGNRGKIIIEFYSNEEFDRIYDLLRA